MDANTTQETGGTLRVRLGVEPRTFQKAWKRTFGYAFQSGRIVTDLEREAMEAKYLKVTEEKPETKPRAKREPKQVEIPGYVATAPADPTAKPLVTEYEKALVAARWELIKQAHKQRASQINPSLYTVRKAPLWAALALTAGASVPNMLDVTFAMKSSYLVSICLTMAFTAAPFLLIMARVKGVFAWMVVVGVMGYTGFCNTASIFGGLTALDVGYVLKPTVFLESVTNLLNTDYLNTARALSGLMALFIGSIEFVAFKNLSK